MHKYQLQLEVRPAEKDKPFKIGIPETTFLAVTSYQNNQVCRCPCKMSSGVAKCRCCCCFVSVHFLLFLWHSLSIYLQLTQLKIDNNPFAKGFRDRDMAIPPPPVSYNRPILPL